MSLLDEFEEESVQTPTKRARAERAAKTERKDAAMQRVLATHYTRFESRFGVAPLKHWGRDKKLLRPYLDSWGEATLDAALAQFMETTDPRVTTGYTPDYGIQHFNRVAQYLRVSESAPALDT